jgi:hypothetical protein
MLPKRAASAILVCVAISAPAWAQTDEIEIYDAAIASPGKFELTVHGNYTPDGLKQPTFPGGVVPNHSLNGAFEWAYGVADFLELGLYLPVYTVTNRGDPQVDGGKLRTLWVVPHARQREFFYGVNFEFSYNVHHWESTRTALEIRPIVGLHEGPWDLIANPILDSDFKGIGAVHLAPAERIAYNVSTKWAFALEHYSDLGPLQGFEPVSQQSQTLFAVVDYTVDDANSLEFGIGHGLTRQSDDVVVKLILNHDL